MILVGDDGSRIELGPDTSDPVGLLVPSPGPKGSKGDKGDKGVGIAAITVSGDNLVFDMSEGEDIIRAVPALTQAAADATKAKGEADRAQTVADGIQDVADDAAQVATDRIAVAEDRTAVAADRQTAVGARDGAVSAKTAAEAARDDAHDTKVGVDNTKTLIDSTLATYGAQFAADLAASELAAGTATSQADIASGAATVATSKRDQSEAFADSARQSAIDAANTVTGVSSVGGISGAVTKAQLGIDKVDNVPDAEKPISGPTQGAFDLMSATFGSIIDGINADVATKLNEAQVQAIANAAAAAIVAGSPASLDTLLELAAALGNDPNFATTVTNLIGTKAPMVHAHDESQVTGLAEKLALLAPKASPAFTGPVKGVPYPMSICAALGSRAVGYLELTGGVTIPDPCVISKIVYSFDTADTSGSTTVELRKNSATIPGTTLAVSSANQAGGSATLAARTVAGLAVTLAEGDVLSVYVSGVGTPAGKGLTANIKAVTS